MNTPRNFVLGEESLEPSVFSEIAALLYLRRYNPEQDTIELLKEYILATGMVLEMHDGEIHRGYCSGRGCATMKVTRYCDDESWAMALAIYFRNIFNCIPNPVVKLSLQDVMKGIITHHWKEFSEKNAQHVKLLLVKIIQLFYFLEHNQILPASEYAEAKYLPLEFMNACTGSEFLWQQKNQFPSSKKEEVR